ncbi:MAG TPA: peptidyl-prolyl cis-trans isomerase [Anaeromyxobacter sp.]|nr:peptidyl-prolyl cis-trans isomerase [Anaeromyxobacter sp.]
MRPRLPIAVLLAALSAACDRCQAPRPPQSSPGGPQAVALVNGEPVPAEALDRELREAQAGTAGAGGGLEVMKRRIVDELVERTLLLQQARARGIVVGQDQVERALLRVRADYPGTHFDDLLAQERLSQAELKARLKEQLLLERLFEAEVFPQIQVRPEEVEQYYASHEAEFQDPESVHVLQIVVASKDEAVQIRDKLKKAPQTFAEVAKRSSIGPEGRNGGDLGLIGRGSGFPEVFDVCFSLPVNAISEVTPSPYGFHIFKVLERRPAQRRPLQKAADEIRQKLLRDKRGRAQAEYVAALRQHAQITYDDKAIASVNP